MQPQQPVSNQQPVQGATNTPLPSLTPQDIIAPQQPQPQPQSPAPQAAQNQPPASQTKRPKNSSQNSLILSELRDSMVIMNDGSMRAVITCRSINFDLMSDQEREAVEFSYQSFLNSLYFPVQILIRSQKVDLGPYLDRLDKIRRDQDNMLLGVLMDDYIDFITALAQETNIMNKSFYVVVPYYPAGDLTTITNSSRNLITNLFAPQSQQRLTIDEATYNKAKDEIRNRVQTVLNGLNQIGIHGVQLNTKELGELYYNVYNPDTAVREPLGNFENMTASVITKGSGKAPQPQLEREQL